MTIFTLRPVPAALVLGTLFSAAAGANSFTVGGLTVSEPGSTVDGLTIAERAIEWQVNHLGTPLAENITRNPDLPYRPGPLFDQGTSFLYGFSVGSPGLTVGVQTSTIRVGQDVLLPVNAAGAVSTEQAEVDDPGILLRDFGFDDSTLLDLKVTINGVDLETATGLDMRNIDEDAGGRAPFREIYGDDPSELPVPSVTIPEGNLFGVPTDTASLAQILGIPEDEVNFGGAIVNDGWFVLIEDIPLGQHEIIVEGKFDDLRDGNLDGEIDRSFMVTQNISVVPVPGALLLMLSGVAALGAVARRR